MQRLFILVLLLSFSLAAWANDFVYCPAGFFMDEASGIQFEQVASWSGDYALKVEADKQVTFAGPIFPGYKLALPQGVDKNPATQTISATQQCAAFSASVRKVFTLVNGSILSTITYESDGVPSGEPVCLRLFFPCGMFAGKRVNIGTREVLLPEQKGESYILAHGSGPEEFRFPLGNGLEMGIKFLDGLGAYNLADCRHHGKPEDHFHLYMDMQGKSIRYLLCLLKPGEKFPAVTPENAGASTPGLTNQARNLLGEGSGFEVGKRNLIPFAYYSWSEAWTSPATAAPAFDPENPQQGKFSLRLQADDMQEVRGRFNKNAVIFKRVRLDPAKRYTLSAWLRTDTAGLRACLDSAEDVWDGTAGKTVAVTKEWARYSYTFTPAKYTLLNYCEAWIGIHPETKKGRLWIDAVQLEEGDKAGEYLPAALEFGAEIESAYKLFRPEQLRESGFTLRLRNNTDKPVDVAGEYIIRDYWDNIVTRGDFRLLATSGDNGAQTVTFPQLPFGYYRAHFSLAESGLEDEAIFGVFAPLSSSAPLPAEWPLGCDAAEGNPLVRELGFGWTRSWDFTFEQICRKAGEFDFTETDIVAERCRKAGLNVVPILGNSFAVHPGYDSLHVPEWAVLRRAPSSMKNSWAKEVVFPTIESWKDYVRAVVGRYKGTIKAWEVLNEANCWLTAEEYVPYMQAAYAAAKEADPDCIIVGGGATSDWSGEPAPWTRRVLELDKCRSMDVLSIHMYSDTMPERYQNQGSDALFNHLREQMRKHGRELPIWHTEKSHNTTVIGYSQNKHGTPPVYMKEPNFRVRDFRTKAEYLLRQTLLDFSTGKGPFFWFGNMPNDIHQTVRRTPYGLQHIEFDGSPCPELLAANGLARMLEGRSTPVELVKLGATRYCALFNGKKGTVAALWDTSGESELTLPNKIEKAGLYNFFGVNAADWDGLSIRLSTAPVYLSGEGISVQALKETLLGAKTSGGDFIVSGGLELNGAALELAVYARNLQGKELPVEVKVSSAPEGWSFAEETGRGKCAPDEYGRFALPLTAVKAAPTPQKIELMVNGAAVTISAPPFSSVDTLHDVLRQTSTAQAHRVASGAIVIDGDVSEWGAEGSVGAMTAGQVKLGRDEWRGQLDLSAQVRLRWDEANLYLAATVHDDVVERNAPPEKGYASDSFEFFLSLAPDAEFTEPEGEKRTRSGDHQFFFVPGMPDGEYKNAGAWCASLKNDAGLKVASRITSDGYIIEAAMAWDNLQPGFKPQAGSALGMSFQVPDSDGAGEPTRKCIFWRGNSGNWKNPALWGRLDLK